MGFILRGKEKTTSGINKRRLCVCSIIGLILSTTAIILALINPSAVIARRNSRITKGSVVDEFLQTKIHSVHVETYLFNVTNAERFLAGYDQKMKVEEVGPFTYKETRTNVDYELDEAAGVIRYTPMTEVTFLPEKSIADPKTVNITMPNIALTTMTSMLSTYSSWTQIPFNLLVRKLKSKPMVTMDAHNYLWGYDEPLITFGNTVMPGWINFEKMGIMDRLYDQSHPYRLEVGATNADKFRIHTLNGIKGMKALHYDDPEQRTKCNTFVDAYEGIAYPPGMTADSKVRIWRNVLCRMLELDFVEQKTLEYGGQALVYKISNRTYEYNPDKMCTCSKGVCINGVSDLSSCFFGLPLAISNAHFLGGEPRLFRKVEGLKPDEQKHGSNFMIEPTIGMVLGTSFTVQVNVVVEDVKFSTEAAPFSNMVVPIAYFRIVQPDLSETQIHMVRMMSVIGPRVFLCVEIVMFLVGISLMGYSMRRLLWNAAFCGETRAMEFTVYGDEKEKKVDIKPVDIPLLSRDS